MHSLVVRGTCGGNGLLSHLSEGRSGEALIDLRRMRFCEPAGLVGIAVHAERAWRLGLDVKVWGPVERNVANYLSRTHVARLFDELDIEHDLPRVVEHDARNALLELQRFTSREGARKLCEMVHDAVSGQDDDAADALYAGLSEAAANVFDHSGRQSGFLAAQKTYRGQRLLFAVGDAGGGVHRPLKRQGVKSDIEALRIAIARGGTRFMTPSRGVGISDVVERVEGLRGSVDLVSGYASIHARGGRLLERSSSRRIRGTVLQGAVTLTAGR